MKPPTPAGIENLHWRDLVPRYDAPDTLFYCDPPYEHSTRADTKAYTFEMTREDHERLLDALLGVTGAVALSGYANALYDGKLASWDRQAKEVRCHGSSRPNDRRKEVVWRNPRCVEMLETETPTLF